MKTTHVGGYILDGGIRIWLDGDTDLIRLDGDTDL